jgi:hypothetical protein
MYMCICAYVRRMRALLRVTSPLTLIKKAAPGSGTSSKSQLSANHSAVISKLRARLQPCLDNREKENYYHICMGIKFAEIICVYNRG